MQSCAPRNNLLLAGVNQGKCTCTVKANSPSLSETTLHKASVTAKWRSLLAAQFLNLAAEGCQVVMALSFLSSRQVAAALVPQLQLSNPHLI